MQNQFLFTRPLSMGEIIDRSFRLYRNNLRLLLLTAAALLLPLGILSAIATGTTTVGELAGIGGVGNIPVSSSTGGLLTSVLSIIVAVATIITTVALAYIAVDLLQGSQTSVSEALRDGRRRFWSYVGMNLLQGLAIGGLLFGGFLLFLLLSFITGDNIVGIGIGILILLILAGVATYIGVRWSVALPAMVEQELSAMDSLTYSWRLTEGSVWRCIFFALILTLLGLIVLILPATFTFIAAIIFSEIPVVIMTLIGTVESVFNVLWLPLYFIAYVIFYFDLRVRSQGYDLSQRIDQLASDAGLVH